MTGLVFTVLGLSMATLTLLGSHILLTTRVDEQHGEITDLHIERFKLQDQVDALRKRLEYVEQTPEWMRLDGQTQDEDPPMFENWEPDEGDEAA